MGNGLRHPSDLVAWRRWHESRHPARHLVRSARAKWKPRLEPIVDVLTPGLDADLLVALEATHASVRQAVGEPLTHLDPGRTAIVAPVGWLPPDTYAGHLRRTVRIGRLAATLRPRSVLAAGHYTTIGQAAFLLAAEAGARFFVTQHGALTPFAPPLPPAAHLFAWSEADAAFWTAGRSDVIVTSTGSQLLWEAGRSRADVLGVPAAARLTYLGQGHAAEIRRVRLAQAALRTCREHGALYRPHPSELDATSRAVLASFARLGVEVAAAEVPLVDLRAPIVSVFSTGVLEAAARGRQAWVEFRHPPAWLEEFWERYDMRRLGEAPTPAPARGEYEPARRIADIVSS